MQQLQQLQLPLQGMLHPKEYLQARPQGQLLGLQEVPLQGRQHPQVRIAVMPSPLHSCIVAAMYWSQCSHNHSSSTPDRLTRLQAAQGTALSPHVL